MKERVVILGAGESGTGSAVLAMVKGHTVFVSDMGIIKDQYKSILDAEGIEYEEKDHSYGRVTDSDLIIKSPGIADDSDIVKEAKKRGIPVISEIEFAGRYTDAFKICITGSNGKTTTTGLIYHILKTAGLNVAVAGNVGESFAMQVARKNVDYYVIELSSFQLDGMYEFKADISVLLNITPDHLDRYNHLFDNYIRSKFRIINNQDDNGYFIYWADDPVITNVINREKIGARLMPFSLTRREGMAAFIDDNKINLLVNNNKETIMTIHDLALKGRHNSYNSMAAAIAGKIVNIRKETIRQCLSDFAGVEHRLESVISVHGINFINDSKATNVNSTWYALECMSGEIVWIAGGVDKGNDYSELFEIAGKKIKAIVCLGKDNEKIKKSFDGIVNTIVETDSMDEAVKSAYYLASKGNTVLLSPACASFDLFTNYEDRGRKFKEAVRNL